METKWPEQKLELLDNETLERWHSSGLTEHTSWKGQWTKEEDTLLG